MVGVLEGIVAIGSMIIPPVFDFVKKKFIPAENDTPEATMGTLAVSNPTILPEYVNSLSTWMQSNVTWFNRDVVGTPSQWVIDLRAAIRPLVVAFSILGMIASGFGWLVLSQAATVPHSVFIMR